MLSKPAVNTTINNFILHGGGGHARVVLDTLMACGFKVMCIFDPKYTGTLMGIPYAGNYRTDMFTDAAAIIAIGDNRTRKQAASETRHAFATVIHPSAVLSSFTQIGEGTMILHGAIVQAGTKIGKHVIINTRASIDHDCHIGDFVHIAPGAVLCGTVSVGEGALVGAGATVLPGIKIGAWSVIGAGSVVTRDVAEGTVVAGSPARMLKKYA
ncbi:MAG: acetyltransferase [Cyclobacteriaceae bacterium]|nr:MAG: acetyltransferase [Cyclobacteriaceae bacterium]